MFKIENSNVDSIQMPYKRAKYLLYCNDYETKINSFYTYLSDIYLCLNFLLKLIRRTLMKSFWKNLPN